MINLTNQAKDRTYSAFPETNIRVVWHELHFDRPSSFTLLLFAKLRTRRSGNAHFNSRRHSAFNILSIQGRWTVSNHGLRRCLEERVGGKWIWTRHIEPNCILPCCTLAMPAAHVCCFSEANASMARPLGKQSHNLRGFSFFHNILIVSGQSTAAAVSIKLASFPAPRCRRRRRRRGVQDCV